MFDTDATHLVLGPREIWIPGFASAIITQYKELIVPRDAQMLFITGIAGGGGGARPTMGAAASGGGGGGTSTLVHLIISAKSLPRRLFLMVGLGGLGATANSTAGANGIPTYLSCVASSNDEDTVMFVNNGVGGSANGTGGSIQTNTLIASMDLISLGVFASLSGIAGAAGATTNGTAVASIISFPMSPGAGGGGSTGGTGGNQNSSSALYPSLIGGAAGDNPGADGIFVGRPFLSLGGAGGGGNSGAGAGLQKGGNGGGYGSGGGGGGNSASGQSGNGGDGAPGLLILKWC